VGEDPEGRFRTNRDNMRWLLGIKNGRGTWAQEEQVTYWQQRMVEYAIQSGQDVVVDDTNLRAKFVKEWLRLAATFGVPVEFKDFPISLAVAWVRDLNREKSVGPDVIEDFYKRYTPKGKLPEQPSIKDEQPAFKFPAYVAPNDPAAQHAIIVDIDGTLAHMEGRSPYDPTLYHTDSFDDTVGTLAIVWARERPAKIILVSGRDAGYRKETEAWLQANVFPYDELYMRPLGDTRNDAIVKNELYEDFIAGHYVIDFVLDDRDRVVAMWRAKGLKVLQVAEGNF
jgi:predicted kinase